LVVAIDASTEGRVVWGVTERRLGVLGLVLAVGLAAVPLGLSVGGWRGALVAGIGSVVAVALVLRTGRLRHEAMRFARWVAPE
jgi:hypothetical protein